MPYSTDVVIALDFDGVLHKYEEKEQNFPVPGGPPVEGASEVIGWLLANRYELVIYSCRSNVSGGVDAIKEWLQKWGFPNIPVSLEKPQAALYIDDRGFRFDGDFRKVISFLLENPEPSRWGIDK